MLEDIDYDTHNNLDWDYCYSRDCLMKLNGTSDTNIMKQGRWQSLTFLQYIHNQISHLSMDLSAQMSTKLTFQNIAAIER